MGKDTIGVIIRQDPKFPESKIFFNFKSRKFEPLLTYRKVGPGQFYNLRTDEDVDLTPITVVSTEDGSVKLHNLPLIIRPNNTHYQAWSPLVGVVEDISPPYKTMRHVVLVVTLDWLGGEEDGYWYLAHNEIIPSTEDPEQFVSTAPWIVNPPNKKPKGPPPLPVPRVRDDDNGNEPYFRGIVLRLRGDIFIVWFQHGEAEITAESKNCNGKPICIGAFVHLRLKCYNDKGTFTVREYARVEPFIDHRPLTAEEKKKCRLPFQVRTNIEWNGEFEFTNGKQIFYGYSKFFGKVYDIYELPKRKLTTRVQRFVDVEVSDVANEEEIKFQVVNVRSSTENLPKSRKEKSAPPKEIQPLLRPPPPCDPSLWGWVCRSEKPSGTGIHTDYVYCFETSQEYAFTADLRSWKNRFVKFKLLENSREPYDVELMEEKKFETRWGADRTPEICVRCSIEGRKTREGHSLLWSTDLKAAVVDHRGIQYKESDFKIWVFRSPSVDANWRVSEFITGTTTLSHQVKTDCIYTGKHEDNHPLLWSPQLKVEIHDLRKITTEPGVYSRWVAQIDGGRWRFPETERAKEPDEAYKPEDCMFLALDRYSREPVVIREAAAMMRRIARHARVQDAVMNMDIPQENADHLMGLLYR